ncbi:gp648 [Bacillus phage G]|uniref:Gp648 n=1 Tax=Bacillus phage G TaxID=2884420 RepID=G3MB28_9CAUD|nr:gp648 [Bacillus phage G]AEO93891.1 gp648 [Bacillus phage G]
MKKVRQMDIVLGVNVKWDSMFDDEEELIKYLRSVDVEKFKRDHRKGYAYVEGFQKQLESGKELSPKQVTQLKRIAKEIYRYHLNF